LGKFITSDNNYLFKPTFSLLYIIFGTLFLIFRAIDSRTRLTPQESIVNAVDLLKEAARNDLDDRQKEQALQLLRQSDQSNPLVVALQRLLQEAAPLRNRELMLPVRLTRRMRHHYLRLVRRQWFAPLLIGSFMLLALADLVSVGHAIVSDPGFRTASPQVNFIDGADLAASITFGALLVIGITRLPRSRTRAYAWFKRALLVSLFFGQVFNFYAVQLWAMVGVMIDLLLLVALNFTLEQEQAQPDSPVVQTGSASTPTLGV
jgi:hypothetical protein